MLEKQDDLEVELRETTCHVEWCGTPESFEVSKVWSGGFDITHLLSDDDNETISNAISEEGVV